jgi:hypothetical protein
MSREGYFGHWCLAAAYQPALASITETSLAYPIKLTVAIKLHQAFSHIE